MRARAVERDDFSWITQELRELPKQSVFFEDVPDDPEYVQSAFQAMHDNSALDGWCVPEEGAFLLFTVYIPWWANRVEASELILWVPAERRGRSRAALELVRRYTTWADKADWIHCAHAGSSLDIVDADKVLKLYEHFGWQRTSSGVTRRKTCVDGKSS